MPRNGSGTYSVPNTFTPGTTISSSQVNANFSDAGTALTNSIANDGQTTTTASIPFAFGLATDTISEETAGAGVTIDGVLLKDSGVTASGAVVLSGVITPTQITANQDNYAPTGFSAAFTVRLSSDAARTITGLAGGAAGRTVELINIGSFPITLANDTTSTAANRFLSVGDYILPAGGSVILNYDTTSSRWRISASTANVIMTVPSIMAVSGTPVNGSGTLAVTLATQSANTVFGGPVSGSAATPTFRALVAQDLPTGAVIQSVYVESATYDSTAAAIPVDDSPPQIGEGKEILSASITPTSATSKIRVRCVFFGTTSGDNCSIALFNGGSAAVAADNTGALAANIRFTMSLLHEETAGGTSSITYSLRYGPATGTAYANGTTSARLFGGVGKCAMTIEEIKA